MRLRRVRYRGGQCVGAALAAVLSVMATGAAEEAEKPDPLPVPDWCKPDAPSWRDAGGARNQAFFARHLRAGLARIPDLDDEKRRMIGVLFEQAASAIAGIGDPSTLDPRWIDPPTGRTLNDDVVYRFVRHWAGFRQSPRNHRSRAYHFMQARDAVNRFEHDRNGWPAGFLALLRQEFAFMHMSGDTARTTVQERVHHDLLAAFRAGGFADEADQEILWSCWNSLHSTNRKEPSAYTDAVQAILDEKLASPWYAAMLNGQRAHNDAWAARGTDYAHAVTEEGWKGFEKHSRAADRAFRAAHALHPEWPHAASKLLENTLGFARRGQGADYWFARVAALTVDHYHALGMYIYHLYPRWHGSIEAMLKFGLECFATRRFDSTAPVWLLCVYESVCSELDNDRDASTRLYEILTPYFDQLWEGYLDAAPDDLTRMVVQRYRAGFAFKHRRYDEAAAAYAASAGLPDRVFLLPRWPGRLVCESNFRAARHAALVALMRGPGGATVRAAWTAYEARDMDAALPMLNALVDRLPPTDAGRSLLLDAVGYARMYAGEKARKKDAAHVFDCWERPQTSYDYAMRHQYPDVALDQLRRGMPLDHLGHPRESLLTQVLIQRRDEVVDALLARGELPLDGRDEYGCTAAYQSMLLGRVDVLEKLVAAGASLYAPSYANGYPAGHALYKAAHRPALATLIRLGYDLNAADEEYGDTALHNIARHRPSARRAVEMLIEAGADMDRKNRAGLTPLEVARENGHEAVAETLASAANERRLRRFLIGGAVCAAALAGCLYARRRLKRSRPSP